MAATEQDDAFKELLRETECDSGVHSSLSIHRNFRILSDYYREDHQQLREQRQKLLEILQQHDALEDRMAKHEEAARNLTKAFYNEVHQGHLYLAAPDFLQRFRPRQPSPAEATRMAQRATPVAEPPITTSPLLTARWADRREWLATLPYFIENPARLNGLIHWDHPLQNPSCRPNDPAWYSSYRPRIQYQHHECRTCHLIGHISWNCPGYRCAHCKQTAAGHTPQKCSRRTHDDAHHNTRVGRAQLPPVVLPPYVLKNNKSFNNRYNKLMLKMQQLRHEYTSPRLKRGDTFARRHKELTSEMQRLRTEYTTPLLPPRARPQNRRRRRPYPERPQSPPPYYEDEVPSDHDEEDYYDPGNYQDPEC